MANYILTEATARGLQELLADRKGIRQAKVGQTVADDGEPLERPDENAVWRVEWMSSLNAFAVYLGTDPLTVNGSSVMPSGVTAAPAPLAGTGWYTIDGFTGGSLWLSVSTDSTTTTAVLSSSQISGAQNILVATVSTSSATGEVSVAQNLLGALVIGGGSAGACVPGLFEPAFEGGVLSSVGNGLFPFGRQFLSVATLDDSAKVATGFIVLEVSHGYGVNPSAVVKKFSDGFGQITNTDTTKTVLPLYLIENGAMTLDCRALLALAMRE